MPIHPFNFDPKNLSAGVRPELNPVVPVKVQNEPNLNRVQSVATDPINTATEDVDSIYPIGFITMDRGVKEFFSNIDVPTKDGTRRLQVRVAGGDKTILYWKQFSEDNRIRLPIMSVNQTGWQLNMKRMTPASAGDYFYRHMADADGNRTVLSPRELPYLINYTLSVWAERKRDMGYILFNIQSRFNPIAEWSVEDETMCGNIIATFQGATDNSDIDIDPNQLAKVRYDFNIQIEGWMPLPGRVVPNVLGTVTELAELDTREFFEAIKPNNRS